MALKILKQMGKSLREKCAMINKVSKVTRKTLKFTEECCYNNMYLGLIAFKNGTV